MLSLEEIALLVRLLKKDLPNFTKEEIAEDGSHSYVKKTYHYYAEVYADSDPDDGKVKDF